jgi:hypothetical protein
MEFSATESPVRTINLTQSHKATSALCSSLLLSRERRTNQPTSLSTKVKVTKKFATTGRSSVRVLESWQIFPAQSHKPTTNLAGQHSNTGGEGAFYWVATRKKPQLCCPLDNLLIMRTELTDPLDNSVRRLGDRTRDHVAVSELYSQNTPSEPTTFEHARTHVRSKHTPRILQTVLVLY